MTYEEAMLALEEGAKVRIKCTFPDCLKSGSCPNIFCGDSFGIIFGVYKGNDGALVMDGEDEEGSHMIWKWEPNEQQKEAKWEKT